jgi:(4-O-methyl)-D-glucuronate---lignin esterase
MLLTMETKLSHLILGGGLMVALSALAQRPAPNYDESKVPAYTLPDPLVCADGTKVNDVKTWQTKRRPELLRLFAEQVYGRAPGKPQGMKFEVTSFAADALGGKATRKEVTIWLNGRKDGPSMNLLLYLPNGVKGRVPAFLGLNFNGNHTISTDPGIKLSDRWMASDRSSCVKNNRATEACRGMKASRWPVETILARGYALATAYYGDLEPDFAEGWKLGVRAALSPSGTNTVFKPDQWGAISAWAWGLSRAMDYLETDRAIDAKRVVVIGHSRLGKTALWAGASDERFAIVISNESGEGGAALARRLFGERIADLNRNFPHWFCGNFKKYSGHENTLPVDQHELIALMAPRPVYVASAKGDRWSDPRGEFLAAKGADPVYHLFGKVGIGTTEMPGLSQPVGDYVGYHIRPGKHDLTLYDWEQYLNFADRHFKR